jgi:hypothetical protein
MTVYARIQNGVVAELFTPPNGVSIASCFVASIATTFVPASAAVQQGWTYSGGNFTAPNVAQASLEARATAKLTACVAAGIAITCTSNPALNETFALDDTTMAQIGSVARDAASGLGLPMNLPVFIYPNLAGEPCQFTHDQVVGIYKAMRDLLFQLNTQAAIMAHGGQPSWPVQAATIA